jgi:hypothetical protein
MEKRMFVSVFTKARTGTSYLMLHIHILFLTDSH